MTCTICLIDFNYNIKSNNNTRIICGECNNPFHMKCSKNLDICPLCRTS